MEIADSALFSPDGRRILADWWDTKIRQWEAFPWREEEYPEVDAAERRNDGKAAVNDREQLALRMRRHADRYWTDRLAIEQEAAHAPPARHFVVPWDRSLITPRDPAAPPNLIDLTDYYTSPVQEMSHPQADQFGWDTNLQGLPRGTVSFNDIPFDVRGIIQLRRTQSWAEVVSGDWWRQIPERVEGIPIGQRFHRLHVLLGTERPAAEGRTIGTLVWHYSDGSSRVCPIDYGRHVRDYWTNADRRAHTT